MNKAILAVVLALSLLSVSAQGQPTALVTIRVSTINWLGRELPAGEGKAIYVRDRFRNLVSRGETDSNSQYTFELPHGTYTVVVLYDENVELLFGNQCPQPRFVLDQPQETVDVQCKWRTYLRFPWMNPG